MRIISTLPIILLGCSTYTGDVTLESGEFIGQFDCVQFEDINSTGLIVEAEAPDVGDDAIFLFSSTAGNTISMGIIVETDGILYGEFPGIDCFSESVSNTVILVR
tara:strand:- start:2220 stop:2534 length:315 start_codon:yes stop_codon:yes gene_type:complete